MNRKRTILCVAVVWVFLMAWVSLSPAQEKVIFCADWTLYGKHAPYIVAREKGMFKQEGIEVAIERGHGSGDTVKRVGAAGCTYGMASVGPIAFAQNRKVQIKTIGILEHRFQETTFYFKESGIKGPKDLEGKRVTPGPKAAADYLLFPIFAKENGIDASKIRWVFMNPPNKPASLGGGQVDAVIDFHALLPNYQKVAQQAGKTLVYQLWADYGLDLYSSALVTHQVNLTNSKSDQTRRFVRGVYRGIAWSLAKPDEAVRLFLKSFPEQSYGPAKSALDIFLEHLFDGLSEKQGLGYADPGKMEKTMRVTIEAAGQKLTMDPRDTYTNSFIEALPKDVRFAKAKK